jgi:hypothetical protein
MTSTQKQSDTVYESLHPSQCPSHRHSNTVLDNVPEARADCELNCGRRPKSLQNLKTNDLAFPDDWTFIPNPVIVRKLVLHPTFDRFYELVT